VNYFIPLLITLKLDDKNATRLLPQPGSQLLSTVSTLQREVNRIINRPMITMKIIVPIVVMNLISEGVGIKNQIVNDRDFYEVGKAILLELEEATYSIINKRDFYKIKVSFFGTSMHSLAACVNSASSVLILDIFSYKDRSNYLTIISNAAVSVLS